LGLLPAGVQLARGSVRFEGCDLTRLPEPNLRRLRGNRISIIFQEPTASLDPLSTVGAQIAEALTIHQRVSRAAARSRALEMLAAVGIPDPVRRSRQYPFELSGGMCQRIMIAIALICGPALLLADEPTTALDVTIQAQILDLMRELVTKQGTSVLLITHDMGVVADIADRVAVMYAGRLAEVADAGSLFRTPRHPYTALLLASVPRLHHRPKAPLLTIDGTVPMPHEMGGGCRFASRCPLASERCRSETPPLLDRGDGHSVACWHAEAVPQLVEAGR
jgi:oligopeptide/dipeptide ABC transporter ATP-binding protein